MNFLELCRRVRQECSISSAGAPSSVTSQTGEMLRVVDWTASEYKKICSSHQSWKFLRSSFTVNTVAGTASYLPSVVTDSDASALITVAEFARWLDGTFKLYLTSAGVATEQEIYPAWDWDSFREIWQRGTPANQRPNTFSIRPKDSAILLGPAPDAIYTLRGDYMKTAPALTLDADVPLIPVRFQEVIVWGAVKRYARYQEAAGLYDSAQREFNEINSLLETDQLPQMALGRPLA